MESMTGYAFVEKSTGQFSFSIELTSLNSKYIETFINLPRVLRNDENEIDGILKKRFGRGKLELSIDIYDWTSARPVAINRELLKKYYTEVSKVQKDLGIKSPFSIDALLVLEGVVQKEKSILSEQSRAKIFEALDSVIEKNIKMRKREGAALRRDILKSLGAVAKNVDRIESLADEVAKQLFQKLKKSIDTLMNARSDDVRLLTEVAILTEKHDINEEIVRLGDHIKKMKQVMDEREQVGKRMDFLAQEMFREINTIASKSSKSEISHLAVDVKNHIDKIREQCRNIV